MNANKVKGITASIVEFAFGGLFVIGGFSMTRGNLLTGLAWMSFGAFLILTGIQWRLLIKDYRSYSTLIGKDRTTRISYLAQATSQSESTVADNLKLMIQRKMVADIAINEHDKTIVNGSPEAMSADGVTSHAQSEPELVTVRCEGCGAVNKLERGAVIECEHCGKPLNA